MKNLFILPCAIMVGENQTDHFERFFQLQHTVDSIFSRFEDAEIKIYELTGKPIYESFKTQLFNCTIITSENDQEVLNIKNTASDVKLPVTDKIRPSYEKGYIKNATESLLICRILKEIDPLEYSRIYKITGRYFFNNSFDLELHDVEGKITLKNKSKCAHGKKWTKTDNLRHCMYWSFCPTILEDVKSNFKKIHQYIIEHSNGNGIASIENGLDLFFDEELINSIEKTGVSGRIDGQHYYVD